MTELSRPNMSVLLWFFWLCIALLTRNTNAFPKKKGEGILLVTQNGAGLYITYAHPVLVANFSIIRRICLCVSKNTYCALAGPSRWASDQSFGCT
jgi:hypothetical protein